MLDVVRDGPTELLGILMDPPAHRERTGLGDPLGKPTAHSSTVRHVRRWRTEQSGRHYDPACTIADELRERLLGIGWTVNAHPVGTRFFYSTAERGAERPMAIESIGGAVQQEVVDYIAAIAPEHRDLFDRVHRLILEACPEAEVVLSYKMPSYRLGKRRLNVATWSHGVSIYGWQANGDGGLTRRHPELQTSRGTIQLRTEHAGGIADEEIRDLARAALGVRP